MERLRLGRRCLEYLYYKVKGLRFTCDRCDGAAGFKDYVRGGYCQRCRYYMGMHDGVCEGCGTEYEVRSDKSETHIKCSCGARVWMKARSS